jgi:hypothetical protein
MTQLVDLLLMRAKVKGHPQNASEIARLLRQAKQNEYKQMAFTYSQDANLFYGYFYLGEPSEIGVIDKSGFLGSVDNLVEEVELSRVVFVNPLDGFSYSEAPNNRYTVEMDPQAGWRDELFAWYDEEHLPGLACVPGCIRATRCINLDHSPYSLAFYDLLSPQVLGCDAWLKVRHTPWSDKVRPHFTNTRRTMFLFC